MILHARNYEKRQKKNDENENTRELGRDPLDEKTRFVQRFYSLLKDAEVNDSFQGLPLSNGLSSRTAAGFGKRGQSNTTQQDWSWPERY